MPPVFFFFFHAEDGIRDGHVTGVQTCALPISRRHSGFGGGLPSLTFRNAAAAAGVSPGRVQHYARTKIGRASCRERPAVSGVGGLGARTLRAAGSASRTADKCRDESTAARDAE